MEDGYIYMNVARMAVMDVISMAWDSNLMLYVLYTCNMYGIYMFLLSVLKNL